MFKSINEFTNNEAPESLITPVFHSIDYKLGTIVDKINNLNNLNDDEIKIIICRQHKMILNYDLFLSDSKTRKSAQTLFTNIRFLNILLDVIGLLNLSEHEVICLNKLVYDYYILPQDKDQKVMDLLMAISYQVNNILVIKLSSKLGINGARILAMIANSTFKEEKKIHRINRFLVKSGVYFTPQDIVDILCIIYERFSLPFIYTMFENASLDYTRLEAKNFDNISIAIVEILNSMTSDNIKKILYDYAFLLKNIKNHTIVRFSLKTIPNTRIKNIINEIESDPIENLIIP